MLEKLGIKRSSQIKESYKSHQSKGETFHFNTILRLSKKFGAERISKDAAVTLSEYLTDELERIIQESDKFTRHAGRKTIMPEDIELAINRKN
jgi:histone H3/H4